MRRNPWCIGSRRPARSTRSWGKKGKSGVLKSQATRQVFLSERDHGIRFVYLPKHTSWLNQIEIVFGVIMRKVIRRGSFTSTADLKDKLTRFIAYFNEVFAKPFRWTFNGRPLETGEQKKTSKRRQRFQRINDLRY